MADLLPKSPYEMFFMWYVSERCNFQCEYCDDLASNGQDRKKAPISTIDVEGLLKTIDSIGKICKFTLSGGGEPLLAHNIVEAAIGLSERGHYLDFSTNLSSKRIVELAESLDPKRTGFQISCHTQELKRLGLVERFVDYYKMLEDKGFYITATEVAYPEYAPFAKELAQEFADLGVPFTYNPFFGEYQGRQYPASYSEEEKAIFGFSQAHQERFYRGQQLCNAGYNAFTVKPNGNVTVCGSVRESLGNIFSGIRPRNSLMLCPYKTCVCPLGVWEGQLFKDAVSQAPYIDLDPVTKKTHYSYWLSKSIHGLIGDDAAPGPKKIFVLLKRKLNSKMGKKSIKS